MDSISLREVTDADVEIFYDYQRDPLAVEMAAFPAREKEAHLQHWTKIQADETARGEAVYDPFCGSGTAIIAAEKLGRVCYAMEIDPQYVQAAVTRWEAFAGQKAVRHRVGHLPNSGL